MLLGSGSFATHIVLSEKLCAKIPDSLTFEDAAIMPAVFATAVCSLFHIGGLKKGQASHLKERQLISNLDPNSSFAVDTHS